MRQMTITKWLGLLVVLAAACGPAAPVYRTTYQYVPPPGDAGRTCATQCELTRSMCQNNAQQQQMMCSQQASMAQQNCNQQADGDYNRCMAQPRTAYGPTCIRQNCDQQQCQLDDSMCVDQYNRCYQTCGGQVQSLRECTANCESAVRP